MGYTPDARDISDLEGLGPYYRSLFAASAISEWSVVIAAATWLLAPVLTDTKSLALFDAVGVLHLLLYWARSSPRRCSAGSSGTCCDGVGDDRASAREYRSFLPCSRALSELSVRPWCNSISTKPRTR